MKFNSALLVLIGLLVCIGFTEAQVVKSVVKSQTYTNNRKDTLALDPAMGYSNVASITYSPRDSNSVKINLDVAPLGTNIKAATGWTLSDSLTYSTTSNTGADKEWVLRNPTSNSILGVKCAIRLRVVQAGSGAGVTSPTYSLVQQYK